MNEERDEAIDFFHEDEAENSAPADSATEGADEADILLDPVQEKIMQADDTAELLELKKWLFAENIRLKDAAEKARALNAQLIEERNERQRLLEETERQISEEKRRLMQELQFFDKKMEILRNGFHELEMDRKKFEKEKRWEENRLREEREETLSYGANVTLFFKGVRHPLALKKRYRDLLKIFHPDNMGGDNQMVVRINQEYNRLKSVLDFDKQA